ncbi:hypothetical protein UK12_14705 [Saccharothrix sp. ST-888]|nr:hypothetical protein UK12_14705 [Saccharothrix sp. ST-888]
MLTVGEVVLSELMTNAVLHAVVSPGRMIAVRLELLGGQLRIEVHDASDAWPIVRPLSGWDGDSGRGLWLVDALSVAWGCCSRPGGVGKFVWALVDGKGGGW